MIGFLIFALLMFFLDVAESIKPRKDEMATVIEFNPDDNMREAMVIIEKFMQSIAVSGAVPPKILAKRDRSFGL